VTVMSPQGATTSPFASYEYHLERLVNAAVEIPGATGSVLRRAILARAIAQAGGPAQVEQTLTPVLEEFVDRVAFAADEICDEDLCALEAAGHCEDAILEIIYCAALGAGLGRLEIVRDAVGRSHPCDPTC